MSDSPRNPLIGLTNISLPYDRKSINAWLRNLYAMDPVVATFVEVDALFPLGGPVGGIGIPDRYLCFTKRREHLAQVEKEINRHLIAFSREYVKLGEAFSEWGWDPSASFKMYNPDMVRMTARVDGPADIVVDLLDPATGVGGLIGLSAPVCLLRKTTPYDVRGVSRLLPHLQNLSYIDKVRATLRGCPGEETLSTLKEIARQEVRLLAGLFGGADGKVSWWDLNQRYQRRRERLLDLHQKKIVAPFAQAHGIEAPELRWAGSFDMRDDSMQDQFLRLLHDGTKIPLEVLGGMFTGGGGN